MHFTYHEARQRLRHIFQPEQVHVNGVQYVKGRLGLGSYTHRTVTVYILSQYISIIPYRIQTVPFFLQENTQNTSNKPHILSIQLHEFIEK